jgi:hypothetical protein
MVDGRVADRGTLPELLGRSAEMRALWEESGEEGEDDPAGRGAGR